MRILTAAPCALPRQARDPESGRPPEVPAVGAVSKRDFPVAQVSRKGFGEGTEMPSDEGKLHLALVIDIGLVHLAFMQLAIVRHVSVIDPLRGLDSYGLLRERPRRWRLARSVVWLAGAAGAGLVRVLHLA